MAYYYVTRAEVMFLINTHIFDFCFFINEDEKLDSDRAKSNLHKLQTRTHTSTHTHTYTYARTHTITINFTIVDPTLFDSSQREGRYKYVCA